MRPCAVLVLFERVPTTDICCLWFEVVECRIGCTGRFVGHRLPATRAGAAVRLEVRTQ